MSQTHKPPKAGYQSGEPPVLSLVFLKLFLPFYAFWLEKIRNKTTSCNPGFLGKVTEPKGSGFINP